MSGPWLPLSPRDHVLLGWTGVLLGVVSGAAIGLFFHRESWMGGYGSFRRRLVRLGHVSFLGLGLLNGVYGLSLTSGVMEVAAARCASLGLIVAAVGMPAVCFATAWRERFRYLFSIPMIALLTALIAILSSWRRA